ILRRTGCGKSTLLPLLTRAWDPSQGESLLNNQPLSGLSEATLRQAMSVVPQRVPLFSAPPRDNPRLALPDEYHAQFSLTLAEVG
ncbi:ATP-binding cassette domain-containing protein, partial [Klebsiella pneumoniae]|uniref:ATP-binding cassette domain-containing protein n=1 Tax=Klebsiella pneumoniae TaxID=573 RepID=UPI00313584FE